MFNTACGVKIPYPEKIEEKFVKLENAIRFNISFEKLESFVKDFINGLSEPLFLVIHLPLNEKEEKKLRTSESCPYHSEVLYLDGQTKQQILDILSLYGQILLNDGLSQFGIAAHKTGDELFIQKYKLVDIYCKDDNKYLPLLKKYGIEETIKLITVWDTFSHEHPGQCEIVTFNNQDIYDVVEELKAMGMYVGKVVED